MYSEYDGGNLDSDRCLWQYYDSDIKSNRDSRYGEPDDKYDSRFNIGLFKYQCNNGCLRIGDTVVREQLYSK